MKISTCVDYIINILYYWNFNILLKYIIINIISTYVDIHNADLRDCSKYHWLGLNSLSPVEYFAKISTCVDKNIHIVKALQNIYLCRCEYAIEPDYVECFIKISTCVDMTCFIRII